MRVVAPPSICLVASRPHGRGSHVGPGPLTLEMTRRWEQHGCDVDVLDPETGVLPLAGHPRGHDLVVLKSGTPAGMSVAGALAVGGAQVVNPIDVARDCRDKTVQTARLAACGVPVPESWATEDPVRLAPLLAGGPLILKDPAGSRGRGLVVVRSRADLARVARRLPWWLAMRYHEPDGDDLKLYRIGDEVHAVERPFPALTPADKIGRPFQVDGVLRDLVLRCGRPWGISVYGVDVVRSRGRRWVVDMSSFPGFKGVPEAGQRLADHLLTQHLRGGRRVAAPVRPAPAGAR